MNAFPYFTALNEGVKSVSTFSKLVSILRLQVILTTVERQTDRKSKWLRQSIDALKTNRSDVNYRWDGSNGYRMKHRLERSESCPNYDVNPSV